jgi:hypothetical protein
MVSSMHKKLGTAGLIVAIVALVAALTGAAFAAGGLTKQQEKQVKKIAKKYAGKRGPAGKQGPAGPQGAPGAKGDGGAKGDTGPQGKEGPEGKVGIPGKEGSPWTAGGVLPSEQSEYGHWSVSGFGKENIVMATGSYVIPLEAKPTFHYVKSGETDPECPGTVAEPKAEPGALCVYRDAIGPEGTFISAFSEVKSDRYGFTLAYLAPLGSEVEPGVFEPTGYLSFGTWAVTAE